MFAAEIVSWGGNRKPFPQQNVYITHVFLLYSIYIYYIVYLYTIRNQKEFKFAIFGYTFQFAAEIDSFSF